MAELSPLQFYLCVVRPVTVFSGLVNGTPTDPFVNITWDNGATGTASSIGTSGAPLPGNTVFFGTSAGGRERGTARLRSWTPANGSGTAGTFAVGENDDTTPNVVDGDNITIKLFWQLWDRVPRQDASNPSNIVFYEDYDIVFTDQTVNWRPMACAGPPAAAFLEAGQAQVSFVGDRSYALAPGASLSSYLWTAHGSSEGTSSSQGTEASPVTFTWTAAGQYLVSLKVTDSNGNTATNYTWVFIIDPAAASNVAYEDFDAISDSFDAFQGGGSCNFTVHGTADITQFPAESLVLHIARGTLTTPTATWPNRSNVLYAGYITGNAIRQDPVNNTTSFRTVTIDGLMKRLAIYPVRLEDSSNPQNWTQAKDLTVDRVLSYLAHYRSTLAFMTNVIAFNYAAELKSQDFNASTLWGMFKSLMADAWGLPISTHQSTLYLVRDYNLMTTAERATATTRKTLHKGLWVANIDIAERGEYEQPTSKIKWNGVYYPGNQAAAIPLFSEAPGDVMDSWGNEGAKSGFILTTQADLNTRTGYEYARRNYQYPTVGMRFLNDGSFTIAPQEIFPANIEAGDNNRGLAWAPSLIPRSIRRTYNHQGGFIDIQVTFEPSVTGPAGATVTMPAKPASATGGGVAPVNDPAPPPPAWPQPTVPAPGPAVAADIAAGVYLTPDSGATWTERNNLLSSPDQLAMQYLIWDPWWFTPSRQGTNEPEQVILLGCGTAFLVKSEDAGKSWEDLSQNLADPNDVGSDTPAPTAPDLTYAQIRGDSHALNVFYLLARWQNGASAWRSWLYRTADNGINWDVNDIHTITPVSIVINHEVGDLSEYSATPTAGGGTISVTGAAALNGTTFGLQCSVAASGDSAQGRKSATSPTGTQYTIEFYFDLNGITIATSDPDFSGADAEICLFQDGGSNDLGFIELTYNGAYKVRLSWYDDNRVQFFTSGYTISNAVHKFTIILNKAATAVSNDGSVVFKVDDVTKETLSSFDLFSDYGALTDVYFGFSGVDAGISGTSYWDEITAATTAGVSAATQAYGMSAVVDQESGTRIYTSSWKDGQLYAEQYSTDLIANFSLDLGAAATINEILNRTYFVSVYPSIDFAGGNVGGTIWIYGRWDDGAVKHLAVSTDEGYSFTDIGDSATWGAGWVGGFIADSINTLYAFVNGGSRALYRSTDGGSSWTSLSSLPFDVDPGGVSKHPDGRILISNRAASGQTAAYAVGPNYSSWVDATGSPSFPASTPGGGSNAIIWIT